MSFFDRNMPSMQTMAERLGVGGLYLFASFSYAATSLANLGLALMLVGALTQWRQLRTALKRDRMAVVLALLAIYLFVRAFQSAAEFPWTATQQWDATRGWLRNFLFLLAAWWFAADTRRVLWCLGLALGGLLARVFTHTDPSLWPQLIAGQRDGFGFTAVGFGLLGGVAVLSIAAFAGRIWSGTRGGKPSIAARTVWLAVLLVLFELVIINQSRSAWYTLVVMLPVTLALGTRATRTRRSAPIRRKTTVIIVMLTLLVSTSLIALNSTTIANRASSEGSVIRHLLSLDFDPADIEYSPVGIRVHMTYFGLRRFRERPLFGWGPGTNVLRLYPQTHYTNARDKDEASKLSDHPHLHSTYLGVIVRMGLVGALLILLAVALFWKHVVNSRRSLWIPQEVLLMGAATFVFSAIWGLADFRIAHLDYGFLTILLGGALYTYHLHRPPETVLRQAQTSIASEYPESVSGS